MYITTNECDNTLDSYNAVVLILQVLYPLKLIFYLCTLQQLIMLLTFIKMAPFIQSLVDVLGDRLNDVHFEDVLLKVKDKVVSKNISTDDRTYKLMPSVLSHMRDRVWFHK